MCGPQAQGIRDVTAVAGDNFIVAQGGNLFGRFPVFDVAVAVQLAAECYRVAFVRAQELPCHVLIQPQVRFFDLLAVYDFLFEHTVLIADAVAHRRNTQSGERIEEAGGQATQAAVAQAGIFFFFGDIGEG